jgi:hypothetical protein
VPTAPTIIPPDDLKRSLTLAQPDNLPHIGLVGEASRYAAASSEQIVEEKNASLRQQQTKHSEDKANLPRQLTVYNGNRRFPQSQGELGESAAGYGSAEPELLPYLGPGRRDREPAQCGNRRQSFARAAAHRSGSGWQCLDDREL